MGGGAAGGHLGFYQVLERGLEGDGIHALAAPLVCPRVKR